MCHEYRAWRSAREARESRRDLWQDFEATRPPDEREPAVEEPAREEGVRAQEPVAASA